jgi:putative endonuclease
VIVIRHFDPLRSRDSAARATSRHAKRQSSNAEILHLGAARRLLADFKNGEPCRVEAVRRRRMKFYYVYILQSGLDHERFYTGFTEDLVSRLKTHNSGNVPHTSKYKPWRIKTAIAFSNRQKAIEFEKYLKSPSGRAFAKKRL